MAWRGGCVSGSGEAVHSDRYRASMLLRCASSCARTPSSSSSRQLARGTCGGSCATATPRPPKTTGKRRDLGSHHRMDRSPWARTTIHGLGGNRGPRPPAQRDRPRPLRHLAGRAGRRPRTRTAGRHRGHRPNDQAAGCCAPSCSRPAPDRRLKSQAKVSRRPTPTEPLRCPDRAVASAAVDVKREAVGRRWLVAF